MDGRLDTFLAAHLPLSRSVAAELIKAGDVKVNGEAGRKSYRPRAGDVIEVILPEAPNQELVPEDIPLRIIFDDDHVVVVSKPAGMVSHPAPGHPSGTLVNALLHHVGRLSSVGLPLRPGIVHRLDRDTSGLMVVAKSDEAHLALSAALARREVGREYLAAAWGHLKTDRVTVDRPIGRSRRDRKRMAVVDGGRPAITHFRRLEQWKSADFLQVRLETGRTHQIRVHLRSLGHPVVGDMLYAAGREKGFVGSGGRWAQELSRRCSRMFLHAARLKLRHPVTGEELEFTEALPPPLDSAAEWALETS
ncbi:MAG: RluA family pseudouridine synthase [Gemmatimonadota bacterium]